MLDKISISCLKSCPSIGPKYFNPSFSKNTPGTRRDFVFFSILFTSFTISSPTEGIAFNTSAISSFGLLTIGEVINFAR